jgi:hypothetical protein
VWLQNIDSKELVCKIFEINILGLSGQTGERAAMNAALA